MSSVAVEKLGLLGIFSINYKLINKTGLLIRSGRAREILGGADVQALSIRYNYNVNNHNYSLEVPYIPGSSLKGRARSLLELALDMQLETTDGKIYYHMRIAGRRIAHDDPYCPVDNIFGSASVQPDEILGNKDTPINQKILVAKCWAPTRAIFRDLVPDDEFIGDLCREKRDCGFVSFEDFLEEKWENRIDRITSAADPRNVLRVRPGIIFKGSISFLVFNIDVCSKEECRKLSKYEIEYPARDYMDYLLASLELIEETYLGGSGTRGYGLIEFKGLELKYYDVVGREIKDITRSENLRSFRHNVIKSNIWDELRKKCSQR